MSSLRLAHGPPIVIGDGPATLPSTATIEPAGVVDTAILHGPLPNVGAPPLVSLASSAAGATSATATGRVSGRAWRDGTFAASSCGGTAVATLAWLERA